MPGILRRASRYGVSVSIIVKSVKAGNGVIASSAKLIMRQKYGYRKCNIVKPGMYIAHCARGRAIIIIRIGSLEMLLRRRRKREIIMYLSSPSKENRHAARCVCGVIMKFQLYT